MIDHMRQVRRRVAEDMDRCVTVLTEVHRLNGYPGCWPADPPAFLSPAGILAAWVAESTGTVVGHVLLCRAPDRMGPRRWTDLIDEPLERIGLVRQLFVSPDCQGSGLGTVLLDTTTAAAGDDPLLPWGRPSDLPADLLGVVGATSVAISPTTPSKPARRRLGLG